MNEQSPTVQNKIEESNKIIKNHVLGAMGVGMLPMPLVDLMALSGVQLNMLRKLCAVYGTPFSKDTAKNCIGSLLGGAIPVVVSGTLASLVKAIPVVGQTTATLVMPGISGAMVYAIGKVFVQHFESGGTFLTFDPDKVRSYYEEMLEEGKTIAPQLKSKAGKTPSTETDSGLDAAKAEPTAATPKKGRSKTDKDSSKTTSGTPT